MFRYCSTFCLNCLNINYIFWKVFNLLGPKTEADLAPVPKVGKAPKVTNSDSKPKLDINKSDQVSGMYQIYNF